MKFDSHIFFSHVNNLKKILVKEWSLYYKPDVGSYLEWLATLRKSCWKYMDQWKKTNYGVLDKTMN